MLLLAVVACAAPARGQEDPDLLRRVARQSRQLDETLRLRIPDGVSVADRVYLDYGGSVRFGVYAIDDRFSNTRMLRQTDGIVYVRAQLEQAHRFFGQLRFVYDDFNAGDSFDGDGDDLREPVGDRYWYSYDLRAAHQGETGETLDGNVAFKVGRQFVHWGSGLMLSRVMYAFLADFELYDVALTTMFARTPTSGTIDFDASRPSFDSNTQRNFYGASLEYRGSASHRVYASFLAQQDLNSRDSTTITTSSGDFPTRFDYDSRYVSLGATGTLGPRWVYRMEAVREFGRGLSSPADANGNPISQTREDVRAWAGVGTLSYLFSDDENTRVDFEVIVGSGDDDRLDSSDTFGGNQTGSTDRAFNAFGYVNTGLALTPDVSNLLSAQVGVSTSPWVGSSRPDALRLGVFGFVFNKLDADAPMNFATDDHTFIGGEIDVAGDWRITSDISLTARYGIFLPGAALPSDQDDPRHFGFLGVTYVF